MSACYKAARNSREIWLREDTFPPFPPLGSHSECHKAAPTLKVGHRSTRFSSFSSSIHPVRPGSITTHGEAQMVQRRHGAGTRHEEVEARNRWNERWKGPLLEDVNLRYFVCCPPVGWVWHVLQRDSASGGDKIGPWARKLSLGTVSRLWRFNTCCLVVWCFIGRDVYQMG